MAVFECAVAVTQRIKTSTEPYLERSKVCQEAEVCVGKKDVTKKFGQPK
jgi:hypothetical protein